MSGLISNKAINTFFRFSIEQGDGSHARALLDKMTIDDSLKQEIRELIATVPVPADKKPRLNEVLGSRISFDQRKPAKIPTSEMRPLTPATGPRDIFSRAMRTLILSFLDGKTLAQMQRVNSSWQRDAMEGAYLQLRDQRTLTFVRGAYLQLQDKSMVIAPASIHQFPNLSKSLHIGSSLTCFNYLQNVNCVTGEFHVLESTFKRWNLVERWKGATSVQKLNMWLYPEHIKTQFSRFPALLSLQLILRDEDSELWTPSLFESCATTLHHLTISPIDNRVAQDGQDEQAGIETVVRSLKAVAGLSQLRSLHLTLPYLDETMLSEKDVWMTIFKSNIHLTTLSLLDIFREAGALGVSDYGVGLFDHASKNLTQLNLRVNAPVVDSENHEIFSMKGMRRLAKTFPHLTALTLDFCGEERYSGAIETVIPFEGAGVLSRAWPELRHLNISGIWSIDNLDTIMQGHPRLETLTVAHRGDISESIYYWRETSIAQTIINYGKDYITTLSLGRTATTQEDLVLLLSTCTRLQSLALKKEDFTAEERPGILALRQQFPRVNISLLD